MVVHIAKLPRCQIANTLVRGNFIKYMLRSISVPSPCNLHIISVSGPYQLRTISLPIDTEQVRSWYGPDTEMVISLRVS
uniref:hypothetical protein n=1 Tax=uncultured Bacteroides sp. TaxID=162156 RepID=UPI00280ACEA9|nr:hypothetical protein [uncultured Bacteroides sp.]